MTSILDWAPQFQLYGQHSWDLGPQQALWTNIFGTARVGEARAGEARNQTVAQIERQNALIARENEDQARRFAYATSAAAQDRAIQLRQYRQELGRQQALTAEDLRRYELGRLTEAEKEAEAKRRFDVQASIWRRANDIRGAAYEPELTGNEKLDAILNELDARTANVQATQIANAERTWQALPANRGTPLPDKQRDTASKVTPATADMILRSALTTIGRPPPAVRFDPDTGRWTVRPMGVRAARTSADVQALSKEGYYDVPTGRWVVPPTVPVPTTGTAAAPTGTAAPAQSAPATLSPFERGLWWPFNPPEGTDIFPSSLSKSQMGLTRLFPKAAPVPYDVRFPPVQGPPAPTRRDWSEFGRESQQGRDWSEFGPE